MNLVHPSYSNLIALYLNYLVYDYHSVSSWTVYFLNFYYYHFSNDYLIHVVEVSIVYNLVYHHDVVVVDWHYSVAVVVQ